jgi:hypothetical protein
MCVRSRIGTLYSSQRGLQPWREDGAPPQAASHGTQAKLLCNVRNWKKLIDQTSARRTSSTDERSASSPDICLLRRVSASTSSVNCPVVEAS